MCFRSALILLNIAILWGARATSMEPMGLDALGRRAQIVVYGRIDNIRVDDSFWRTAQMEVIEQVRGNPVEGRLSVRLLQRGSRENGWIERIADAPELREGEEVLLFLNWSARVSAWVPIGLKQGKYRVETDSKGVRRALSWRDAPINQVSDAEILSPTAGKISATAVNGGDLEKLPALTKIISHVRGIAQ